MSSDEYQVEWKASAAKSLVRLGQPAIRRIAQAVDALQADPRPPGAVKIAGMSDAYRVRVGVFRVVYRIDDTGRIVTVTRVGHRKNVYEGM